MKDGRRGGCKSKRISGGKENERREESIKKSSHVTEEGQIAKSEGPFTLRSLRDDVMTNRRYIS